MKLPGSIRELVTKLRAGTETPYVVRMDVGGCRINVASNDTVLARKLERYFREVLTSDSAAPDFSIVAVQRPAIDLEAPWRVKEPDAGKTKIKEEWVDLPDGRLVRKRLTGMVFAFGGDVHLAYGPCRENDNQVVNFVNNRYMQWRLAQGWILAHAGAVARDGRCVALAGRSGSGKSTAALDLLAAGLDFVSNDRLLLRPRNDAVDVRGIPKHPRVNPGTILHNSLLDGIISPKERARLLEMDAQELRGLEQKYDVIVPEVVGPGRFVMAAELEALIVFNWSGGGPPVARTVRLVDRPDLLEPIKKSPGLFYEPDAPDAAVDLSDERYLQVLGSSRVIEITGMQDFQAAARLCMDELPASAARV
jgi:HprK-related kinase B